MSLPSSLSSTTFVNFIFFIAIHYHLQWTGCHMQFWCKCNSLCFCRFERFPFVSIGLGIVCLPPSTPLAVASICCYYYLYYDVDKLVLSRIVSPQMLNPCSLLCHGAPFIKSLQTKGYIFMWSCDHVMHTKMYKRMYKWENQKREEKSQKMQEDK